MPQRPVVLVLMSLVVLRMARLPVAAVLLVLSSILGGCVGTPDETTIDPPETALCTGEGGIFATIAAGGVQLRPETATATLPVQLCVRNDDSAPHTLKAYPWEIDQVPDWAPPMVMESDGDGHDHGSDGGGGGHAHDEPVFPEVFALTVAPGETVQVADLTTHGLFFVRDAAWADLNAIWEILPAAPVAYPVAVHRAEFTAAASGDTMAGGIGTASFVVAAPDLEHVAIEVVWDDADDDGPLGAAANEADQIEVRLVDPLGNVVDSQNATKRTATVVLEFHAPVGELPTTASALGFSAAVAAYHAENAPDLTWAGDWKLEVEVFSAGGLVPDSDGTTQDVPLIGDGHQSWNMTTLFSHRFATVHPFGTSPVGQLHLGPL